MLPTHPLVLRLALAAGMVLAADPGDPLRVLRADPAGVAAPSAVVTVVFDRPVAGSLDRTVDPTRIFRITPAVRGRAEWRDPVTLRFRPAAALPSGAVYRVTLSDSFAAMDGSRLDRPYSFTFRVRGPRVLLGRAAGGADPRYLPTDAAFEIVTDAPADPERVARAAYLKLDARCSESGVVRLRVNGQRRIIGEDPWELRDAGGYERDRLADPLRRVVRLSPTRRLPRGCAGHLVAPTAFDPRSPGRPQRWAFATYGDFALTRAGCGWGSAFCPTGPIALKFSTPVKGADLLRHLRLGPAVRFAVGDTADTRADWTLEGGFAPHTTYTVTLTRWLTDAFGQRLTGRHAAAARTTGYEPAVNYSSGRAVIERRGARTFGLTFVNADTLDVLLAPVPDTLEDEFMATSEWRWNELWPALLPAATRRSIAVGGERDRVGVFGMPVPVKGLYALQVGSPRLDSASRARRPIALLQVTDLGVHARVGAEDGVVWVTGAGDGRARPGAAVALRDARGRLLARAVTDSSGIARFPRFRKAAMGDAQEGREGDASGFTGYVAVILGDDRALTGINDYDPDLSPWRFKLSAAWGGERLPAAGAVFTERGIYRPGEPLHAKAIVRTGLLGALRRPAAGDSLRWVFEDRAGEGAPGAALADTTVALSQFGTADQTFRVPAGAAVGEYRVAIQLRRGGQWTELDETGYRVAEYRPPEFLVDVTTDSVVHYAGDAVGAEVEARYLFGAPMGRAAAHWTLRHQALSPGELDVPGTEGFTLGETGDWNEEPPERGPEVEVGASGTDTLDPAGRLALRLAPGAAGRERGRPLRATVEATVTDVNRQTVSASASLLVHPAAFYLGARPEPLSQGDSYFWTAGRPVGVGVIAVRPDGRRVADVRVSGAVVRREWHQVRRERAGYAELVGEWVDDTVAGCGVVTAPEPVRCGFTPPAGGAYVVILRATDAAGRRAVTRFYRWAVGSDWVPWNDESQFKMDVVPDRARYTVGDTATVLFASPFTDAEAWVTVEREGLIQQRRLRITSGTTTLKYPITEAFAPNAYVSIVVARGRSAPSGPLDDPGRPTIRVGYAELRVTPERKRLTLDARPLRTECRPGDTAQVRLTVRDAAGRGQRSEVTLWAVDEGVLALTGYTTPDPIDLIYRPRGLGMRLASNLTTVVPQVPEGEKGGRAPGGGGGHDGADILRSRFQSTAFFLGSVVTDGEGKAVARARLPDNLTTFRIMAMAVTAGDRYGSGQSPLLVTRPLVARPALPRFVRADDRFSAGVVVNRRPAELGARQADMARVTVTAEARGARLGGKSRRSEELEPRRGREVRFDFTALSGDSASFQFRAELPPDADAVMTRLPVRPNHHPRAYTVAGVLHDSTGVDFRLPADLDPTRSTLSLSLGTSPLPVILAAYRRLRVYPYDCTEQLVSAAQPLIALYRARWELGADSLLGLRARADIERTVAVLVRRQRDDGGIGLWSAGDWTTPWLSAYAGGALLDARAAGIAVNDSVLERLGRYLRRSLSERGPVLAPVASWYESGAARLSDRVMAVDYLSRAGVRDQAAENELLRIAPQLAWEDRVRLALALSRGGGGDRAAARGLLEPAWRSVRVEGRAATLPEPSRREFYFYSPIRPAAWLLSATLAVDPAHPLVGPLVETLTAEGRGGGWIWNTQDYGTAVSALAEFQRRRQVGGPRDVRVRIGGRLLARAGGVGAAPRDSIVALAGLVRPGAAGTTLQLSLATDAGASVFYALTVTAVPRAAPVRPDNRGLQVERWYERYEDGRPVTEVTEGDLVRVRLRVSAPRERDFVVLDDPLPAGLEAVDLSLRTAGGLAGPGAADSAGREASDSAPPRWAYGTWDSGWWSPFDHKELRDDRVVYFATRLWRGSYTATYVARATTPGVFTRPPAHAEEMYNPSVHGESDGGVFTVRARASR